MKHTHLVLIFFSMCCLIGINTGCGKKGDPVVPVAPQPLPIAEVTGRLSDEGVVLSWNPPTQYTTNKELELDDIKYFTILRQTEAPVANRWEFSDTLEGWSETGRSLPLKRHKGTLRTASEHAYLIINSPEDLKLKADENRYIRFTLWAKNSQQGYITFITKQEPTWDTNFDRHFQPAVHTSYYSFNQEFKSVKVKPFRILSSPADIAHEYVVDMHTLPTWKGTIQQIGIVLKNDHPTRENTAEQAPDTEENLSGERPLSSHLLEAGLDSIEFVETLEQDISLYETHPWVFLDGEEGWTSLHPDQAFGASDGVFYAQGNDMIILFSRPGQHILANSTNHISLRMKVTEGKEAYLLLKLDSQNSFPDFNTVSTTDSSSVIRIPLQDHEQFHTYTLDMNRYVEMSSIENDSFSSQKTKKTQETLQTADNKTPSQPPSTFTLSQLALVFPAVTSERQRQLAIDYIDVVADAAHTPLFAQSQIPSLEIIAKNVQKKYLEKQRDFDMPYSELPDEKEQTPVTQIALAKISPHDPAPAEIKNNTFFLTDTGHFTIETDENENETIATLEYGNRYTYQVLVTDRKKRQSQLSPAITVDFVSSPAPPKHVSATPGDGNITLTWDRPIFTVDGKKIHNLTGYQVFRSQTPSEYLKTPTRSPETPQVTDAAIPQHSETPPRSSEKSLDSQSPTTSGTTVPETSAPTIEPRPDLITVTPKTLIATLPSTRTRFTDTGLLNGRKYYYTIVARTSDNSDFGMSEHSEEIVAVPMDNRPPVAPTGLVGVYLKNTVTLHWKQEGKKDLAGFNIFRSDSAAGPFQQLNAEPVLRESYGDTTAEANKRYYYHITAIDDELPPNESLPSEITLVETFSLD